MAIYAEHRAAHRQPPYDENSAADRQRFQDFKGGFVQGIGEALNQVLDEGLQRAPKQTRVTCVVSGRN